MGQSDQLTGNSRFRNKVLLQHRDFGNVWIRIGFSMEMRKWISYWFVFLSSLMIAQISTVGHELASAGLS